jgi:spore coat protein U-like protein
MTAPPQRPRSTIAGVLYRSAALAVMLLAPLSTQAACKKLSVDSIDRAVFNPVGGYDVFGANTAPTTAPVSIHNSTGSCSYFITVGTGQSGGPEREMRNGAGILRYQIYAAANQGNILRDIPGAAVNEVLGGTLGPGDQSHQRLFYLAVPAHQVVPPGTYRDTVAITLYEGDLSAYTEIRSRNVQIQAFVPERIDLSVVDTGMAMDPSRSSRVIDFGSLTQGKTSSFDLLVRSNAGYTITMMSENNGAMKILDPGDSSTIPYVFRLAGSAINLDSKRATVISSSATSTTAAGEPHNMQVTIGPVGDATAGDYQDNLTITIIANP